MRIYHQWCWVIGPIAALHWMVSSMRSRSSLNPHHQAQNIYGALKVFNKFLLKKMNMLVFIWFWSSWQINGPMC